MRWLSGLVALAAVAAAGPADLRAAPARPPNIVFILADDLGYGDLGCYGQKEIRTPNLDRLARQGVRFTDFYAGSTVCAPSRCVLMTGKHTGHAAIRGNSKANLGPGDLTLAEVLKGAGYATGLVGKWGLGHEGSAGVPTRKGFDFFYGYLDQTHAHNYYPTFLMRNETRVPLRNVVPNEGPVGQGVATVRLDYSPDLCRAEALQFIEKHRDRPFFLAYTSTLPHANNEAGRNGMEVPDLDGYRDRPWPEPQKAHAAMITRLDSDAGELLARLERLGLAGQTVVFFSSDNGPHREGGNDPDFHDSNGPLRGIKRDLYEGGIRVPMIVRWPGHAPEGKTSGFVGYFADLLPTLAQIAGAAPPPGTDGLSFLPSLLHPGESANGQGSHAVLYWEFYERGGARAVRMGDWKAVQKGFDGPVELYRLSDDPGESRNVAADHPDVVARAAAAMKAAHVPSPLWKVQGN